MMFVNISLYNDEGWNMPSCFWGVKAFVSPFSLALDTAYGRGGLCFFLIKGVIERVRSLKSELS